MVPFVGFQPIQIFLRAVKASISHFFPKSVEKKSALNQPQSFPRSAIRYGDIEVRKKRVKEGRPCLWMQAETAQKDGIVSTQNPAAKASLALHNIILSQVKVFLWEIRSAVTKSSHRQFLSERYCSVNKQLLGIGRARGYSFIFLWLGPALHEAHLPLYLGLRSPAIARKGEEPSRTLQVVQHRCKLMIWKSAEVKRFCPFLPFERKQKRGRKKKEKKKQTRRGKSLGQKQPKHTQSCHERCPWARDHGGKRKSRREDVQKKEQWGKSQQT